MTRIIVQNVARNLCGKVGEVEMSEKVEFIESYIKVQGGDYQWSDNHGELIRCKDCVHWIPGIITDKDDFIQPRCKRNGGGWSSDDYCSCAEKRTDEI